VAHPRAFGVQFFSDENNPIFLIFFLPAGPDPRVEPPRVMMMAAAIRGNWAALLLPINRDESIDFGLLRAEIECFIAAKVDGVYSNGSAGEFYAQSESEFDAIQALLAEICAREHVNFQIGASYSSPQTSLERIRRTFPLRPLAFQIVLPDWFPPTLAEIIAFLERMAEAAAPIPLVVYNPLHAKRRLAPPEWQELTERIPAIAGIKVPGGDEAWYRAMGPVLEKISVFIPGHTLATGLSRGAQGSYSSVACLSPAGAQRWSDLCRTDPAAALRWEDKIRAFWRDHLSPLVHQRRLPNMAADKAAAVAGGWLPGLSQRLRWPYQFATDDEVAALAANAHRLLPELFSP